MVIWIVSKKMIYRNSRIDDEPGAAKAEKRGKPAPDASAKPKADERKEAATKRAASISRCSVGCTNGMW